MDHRNLLILLIVSGVWLNSGCNRRCQSPGGCGPFASSRIPAPGTGLLSIPSRSAQQPYYTPGGSLAQNSIIDPNQSAPTLNQSTADLNGWTPQPVGGQPTWMASNAPVYNNQPPMGGGTTGIPPGYQVATSSTLSSNQSSSTNNQNNAVASGSRPDPTRLPATDATAIRAPTTAIAGATFQPPMQQAPRFSANLNVFQPIVPPQIVDSNPTGQPRFQAQPMVAAAPRYQSPYIRSGAQMGQPNLGSQVGWAPRSGDRETNR